MQTPPLPPELWNLSIVILLCGLMGWTMRLVRLLLIYLEARFAVQQNAVIHLEKLGPSLHVLRHASMWHFHQLLRTQLQVASAAMKRIRLPFEIVTSSVKLVESEGDQQQHARMNLSIEVKSDSKCVVQVFWNVKASSLEGAHQSPTNASMNWPIKRRTEFIDAILPTRAALRAIHAVRSLPGKLYEMDFASKPHQLLDDDNSKSNVDETIDVVKKGRAESNLTRLFVAGDSYHSRSVMERRGVNEFVASIPNVVFTNSGAVAVVESSIVATDCEDEKPGAPSVDEPRYACVVAIGSPHFFESAAGPKSPGSRLKRRLSGSDRIKGDEEDEVLCQCVAIDFLPTPAKPSRTPAIVKKLLLTATDAFTSQEIFGPGGECVICLERPLAAVLLPCRHLCVCHACLEEIEQCPICRSKFSTYACFQDVQDTQGTQDV